MTRASAILIRLSLGLFAGLVVLAAPGGTHAGQLSAMKADASHKSSATYFSAQERRIVRRAPRRVPIYRGSSYPGPNAVRVCNAYYEQEYRPSGTVIVPRMRCTWRG